jgi:hypothetical protein
MSSPPSLEDGAGVEQRSVSERFDIWGGESARVRKRLIRSAGLRRVKAPPGAMAVGMDTVPSGA